jgi:hypothetical protein
MNQEQTDQFTLPFRSANDPTLQSILNVRSKLHLSRQHLEDLCFEAFSAGSAVLSRPELRNFIANGLKYDSIDDFVQSFGVQFEQLLSDAEDAFEREVAMRLIFDLVSSCNTLVHGSWLELGKQPQQFKKQLDELLSHIRSLARVIAGVPNHRRPIREVRDRELWLLKRMHPDWTWGQLGLKFDLSRGAAEFAYKRQARRERGRLYRLIVNLRFKLDCDSDTGGNLESRKGSGCG